MARYDRDFLVQHLEDICALYAAKDRVELVCGEIRKLSDEVKSMEPIPKPEKEIVELETEGNAESGCMIAVFLSGLLFVPLSVIGLFYEFSFLASVVTLIIYGLIIGWHISKSRKREEINKRRKSARDGEYEVAYARYNIQCEQRKLENNRRLAEYSDALVQWNQESEYVTQLIDYTFSANIIPRQYRDRYTITYLHDYFSGSREDDLAMALNTYTLEKIKDRLDRIIEGQSEIILTQYAIMGNQVKLAEQREQHHREMVNKLDRIKSSIDDQQVYLDLINRHEQTLEYFAKADYIRNT